MKTMLDKCAVAGDITQAIDRRGAWSCAITVIGGTESTAVKLQSCETAGGTFEDFKTLIPSAEASASQYKGFVVDISGAGNFIKVVGATMATCVLGDCDADVKKVAIKAGEVPSGADLEDNHTATITENGTVEILPSEGKDGMKKVTATVNVAGGSLNAFEDIFPAIYITSESVDEPPNRDYMYVAVTEDGAFVDLAHLEQAKFIVPIENSGSPSSIYTTGAEGTTFGGYDCITGQDFTVTNGKITLDGSASNIFDVPKISFADVIYGIGS